MIFHDSVQSYSRTAANIGVRQQLAGRNGWALQGNTLFWKTAGKMSLAVCAVTLVINIIFGAYASHIGSTVSVIEEQRHKLMDRNISLRATRAGMLTEHAVQVAAGKTLSLYKPEKGQHFIYSRKKGRFISL